MTATAGEFWSYESTVNARNALLQSQRLTIVTGAGVSMSNGLPGWSGLLNRLAEQYLNTQVHLEDEVKRQLGDFLRRPGQDVLELADMLTQFLGRDGLKKAAHAQLYETADFSAPRSLLAAVSSLIDAKRRAGSSVRVITVNYDDLLETVGNERARPIGGSRTRFKSIYDRMSHVGSTQVPVYHIHGFLPTALSQSSQDIILSRSDFARDWSSHWSHGVFQLETDQASDDVWLLVGLSMNDLHVIEYVKNRSAEASTETFVLASRDDRDWSSLPHPARLRLEKSFEARLQAMGVSLTLTDWRHEQSIVLNEISNELESKISGFESNYESYEARLQSWWYIVDDDLLISGEPSAVSERRKSFRKSQKRLANLLATCVAEFADEVERLAPGSPEQFKAELWLRDDPKRSDGEPRLYCVGHSHLLRRAPAAGPSLTLQGNLSHVASRAFAHGSVERARNPSASSRWRTFAALPLELTDEPHYGLSVGSLVLASDHDPSTLNDERLADIFEDQMASIRSFLSPDSKSYLGGVPN